MKYFAYSIVVLLAYSCSTAQKRYLDHNDSKSLTVALETRNLPALRKIFSKIPGKKEDWSSSDSGLLNQSLELTMAYGDKCDKKIISYLTKMGAKLTYYNMGGQSLSYSYEKDAPKRYKIPFCNDSLIRNTLKEVRQKAPSYYDSEEEYQDNVKHSYMESSYKYIVEYLNATNRYGNRDTKEQVAKGLNAYGKIVSLAMKWGKKAVSKI